MSNHPKKTIQQATYEGIGHTSMKGGVRPVEHKKESTQHPIIQATLPKQLVVPIRQHMGIPGHLIVTKGDYVYKGQAITEQPDGLGSITHAPTSGTVTTVDQFPVPHISGYSCPGIIIEPDGKEDWGDQCLEPLKNYLEVANEDLLTRIRESGVVGMGGAAFPSAVKISGSSRRKLNTLVINGAECEPYITCDDMLMRESADEVVVGIQILLKMLKPKQCLVGIESNKPEAIEAMRAAAAIANNAQADTGITKIKVVKVPTMYPSGDAKQLTKILTGIEIPKGKRSYDMGSLCHNVATAHSVYKAVVEGEPLISRVVTVAGAGVKEPQNYNTLFGTSFAHLVSLAGGYTHKAERLIMGGPMMGYAMKTDDIPVVKMTNCILAIPNEDFPYSSDVAMPCIRCGKCADACPVDLLPQQLYWHSRANDFEKVQDHNLFDCIECGCCSYVCPSNIPLVDYYRYAKSAVREDRENKKKIEASRERHEFRELRQARDKAERDAKRAKHKAALQKKKAAMKKKQAAGGTEDLKSEAIKAAVARAKAKKAAMKRERGDADISNKKGALDEAKLENIKTARAKARARKAAMKEKKEISGDSNDGNEV